MGPLIDKELTGRAAAFQTPLTIMQEFGASGADGLVASRRLHDSVSPGGMEGLFCDAGR